MMRLKPFPSIFLPFTCMTACLAFFAVGCATVEGLLGGDDEPPGTATEPAESAEAGGQGPAPMPAEHEGMQQLELKNAKLWTRLDELEEQVARQKEKLAVLEQSLNLGVKPIHLSGGNDSGSIGGHRPTGGRPPAAAPEAKPSVPSPAADPHAAAEGNADPAGLQGSGAVFGHDKPADPEYERMFAEAHEMYLAGRFGPAILKLAEMEKAFGQTMAGGLHVYWVGRCWLALKEYATARSRLEDFLKTSPASPYVPRAKVDLAKAEFGAGLSQTALKRLQEVIEKHPYEDAAELARYELEQIKREL